MSQHLQSETEAREKLSGVKFVHRTSSVVLWNIKTIKLFRLSVLTVYATPCLTFNDSRHGVCLGQKSIHPYRPGSSNVLSWLYTNSLTVMLFGGNPVLYIIAFFSSIDLRCQINPSLQSKLIMNAFSCSCHEVARGGCGKIYFQNRTWSDTRYIFVLHKYSGICLMHC